MFQKLDYCAEIAKAQRDEKGGIAKSLQEARWVSLCYCQESE